MKKKLPHQMKLSRGGWRGVIKQGGDGKGKI